MCQPHGDAAAFPCVVDIEVLAAARAVGVLANGGSALLDGRSRFAQSYRSLAGRQHGAGLPPACVRRLLVPAHRSAELVGLLLDPVADINTTSSHDQDQEHEKCQHADKNFHARAASRGSGRNRGGTWHSSCLGCRLGRSTLRTKLGSVGQGVATTHTECSHLVRLHQAAQCYEAPRRTSRGVGTRCRRNCEPGTGELKTGVWKPETGSRQWTTTSNPFQC